MDSLKNIVVFLLFSIFLSNSFAVSYFDNLDIESEGTWDSSANWVNGIPTSTDWAVIRETINSNKVACLISDGVSAEAYQLVIANDSTKSQPVTLEVTGGSLTTGAVNYGDIKLGQVAATEAVINMSGGYIDCRRDLFIGMEGSGVITVTSGTIDVLDDIMIPQGNGSGVLNIHGGTVMCHSLTMQSTGRINITVGALIIDGNVVSVIQDYVMAGYITAYDGKSSVRFDYGQSNPGKTTVIAASSDVYFEPSDNSEQNRLWLTDSSWNLRRVPNSTDIAIIRAGGCVCRIDATANADVKELHVGQDAEKDVYLVLDEGSLAVNGDLTFGRYADGPGIGDVNGGNISCEDLWVGVDGDGVLTITDGEVNVLGDFRISDGDGDGTVSIDAGVLYCENFTMESGLGSGLLNLVEGMLVIDGDEEAKVSGYVTSGLITACGNSTQLVNVDYNVSVAGKTTVKAGSAVKYFDNWGYNDMWSDGENWQVDSVPASMDYAVIRSTCRTARPYPGLCCMIDDSVDAVCLQLKIGIIGGDGEYPCELRMTGGTLTVGTKIIMGDNQGYEGVSNILGGIIQCEDLWVGRYANGTLNVWNGEIAVSDELCIPKRPWDGNTTAIGIVNLYGGTISCTSLNIQEDPCSIGFINIAGGVLVIDGNVVSMINGYVSAGQIVGNDGNNVVVVDYDSGNDKTTVSINSAVRYFDNWGYDDFWDNSLNWTGSVPTLADYAVIRNTYRTQRPYPGLSCVIDDNVNAQCLQLKVATSTTDPNYDCELKITGGSLTVSTNFIFGDIADRPGSGTITGGFVKCGNLWVGKYGDGVLNMYGGEVNTSGEFCIPKKPSDDRTAATGVVNLYGGTVICSSLVLQEDPCSTGLLNIGADGTFVIEGNVVSAVSDYITSGLITANDGYNAVSVDYDSVSDITTVVMGASVRTFSNWGTDDLWTTTSNWGVAVPTSRDYVVIRETYRPERPYPGLACLIDSSVDAECLKLAIGYPTGDPNYDCELKMTGGELTVGTRIVCGEYEGIPGVITMTAGDIQATNLWVGDDGNGTLTISGGTINVTSDLSVPKVPWASSGIGSGKVNLNGGTISCGSLVIQSDSNSTGQIDITGGVLIINGNVLSKVKGYIEQGLISAYDYNSVVDVEYNPETGD